MPFKNAMKRRDWDRNRRRRQRARAITIAGTRKFPSDPKPLETAKDTLVAVAEQISLLRCADIDIVVRTRATGYLAGVALKAIEITEVEERLSALEEAIEAQDQGWRGDET